MIVTTIIILNIFIFAERNLFVAIDFVVDFLVCMVLGHFCADLLENVESWQYQSFAHVLRPHRYLLDVWL